MYITKSGVIQKIDEDAWPLWRDLGWGIDQDRDGTPDSLSGGGDTSGLLPIAKPAGATVTDVADTSGTGTYQAVTLPGDKPALAFKQDSDDFPWLLIMSSGDGIYMGDGSYDPYTQGVNIFPAGVGDKGIKFAAPGGVNFSCGAGDVQANGAHANLIGSAGASVTSGGFGLSVTPTGGGLSLHEGTIGITNSDGLFSFFVNSQGVLQSAILASDNDGSLHKLVVADDGTLSTTPFP